jgi:DNA-directed RNA polymerase specialized sigma24 family protein
MMRVKEYLHQAYRLDHRINSDIEEMARLREMATSVSSPVFGDKVQTSHSGEAPFVRYVEKIMALEEQINAEIDTLVDLKEQIRGVIDKVPDTDERMVLRYRYVHNYTWEQIGDELNADKSTVRRWHGNALLHAEMPENPIVI